jgi:A/G-specific adenine glycosylase
MNFSNILIAWYLDNKRDLPWRSTTNPYHIWLSEIMLQQTRVAQALPYFFAFSEAFPTVTDLADASEDKILRLWQGLGYYSRARNMHATAKIIAEQHHGNFPNSYKELIKLKGIGPYTAAAIASFAFREAVAVVDGNVYRVLSRIFGIDTDIAKSEAKSIFFELAQTHINVQKPDLFNQAIMEFGALQCVPKNPNCGLCPFAATCFAFQNGQVANLPVKSKAKKARKRYFNYFVVSNNKQQIILQQRIQKDIWQKLYEFPLLETDAEIARAEALTAAKKLIPNAAIKDINLFPERASHKLSHQIIELYFWKLQVEGDLPDAVPLKSVVDYPMPIALHNFTVAEISRAEK